MSALTLYKLILLSPPILSCVLTSLLALALLTNPKTRSSSYTLLFALMAGWNLCVASLFVTHNPNLALILVRIIYVCVSILAPVVYRSFLSGTLPVASERAYLTYVGILLGVLFSIPNRALISSVREVMYLGGVHHYYGVPGPYHWIFAVYVSIAMLAVAYRLGTRSTATSYRETLYQRYLYVCIFLFTVAGVNDLLPYLGAVNYPHTSIPVYPFGSVATAILPIGIAHVGLRYGFLGLDYSLRRMGIILLRAGGFGLALILSLYVLSKAYLVLPWYLFAIASFILILVVSYALWDLAKRVSPGDGLKEKSLDVVAVAISNALEGKEDLAGVADAILSHLGSLAPERPCWLFIVDSNEERATAYRSRLADGSVESRTIDGSLPVLPFQGTASDVVMGIDVPIEALKTLDQALGAITDHYVWLRHSVGSVAVAVTAFSLPHHRPLLNDVEINSLLLMSGQIAGAIGGILRSHYVSQAASDLAAAEHPEGILRSPKEGQSPEGVDSNSADITAMDEVTNAVAHDIRNQITLVQIELSRLKDRVQSPGALPDRAWERVNSDLRDIFSLSMDLGEFSSTSLFLKDAEHAPLEEIVESIRSRVQPHLEMGISFVSDVPPGLSVPRRFFETVLGHLIGNAFKSIPEPAAGRVELSAAIDGASLVVRVQDNGVGLTERELGRIFIPLVRRASLAVQGGLGTGSGLGLSIVKRLVESAEGTITARSRIGQGSIFEVKLPLSIVRNC